MLQLYEQHCPGFGAILAIVSVEQELCRLLTWSIWSGYSSEFQCLLITPIVHPQRWNPHDPMLTGIDIPLKVLDSGVHPLLASILAPHIPQICLETTLSLLRYLQSGGHSVKTRKSLKHLLKSSHYMGLKMRPWLSRFRKRQHCHYSSGFCGLDERRLHSAWWGSHTKRPSGYKGRVEVPFHLFSHRLEYASNYDLWCTYQYALLFLPFFLANAPPDSQLASVAADCIFNNFCTAYPWETREAKKSITQYLSRCRPVRTMPMEITSVVDGMIRMDVD